MIIYPIIRRVVSILMALLILLNVNAQDDNFDIGAWYIMKVAEANKNALQHHIYTVFVSVKDSTEARFTTSSEKPSTDEDVTYATPPKNGRHIHIHPYLSVDISLYNRNGIYKAGIGEGPSNDDYRGAPGASSGRTDRNIVVDSRAIYLINSDKDQTIILPKNIQ